MRRNTIIIICLLLNSIVIFGIDYDKECSQEEDQQVLHLKSSADWTKLKVYVSDANAKCDEKCFKMEFWRVLPVSINLDRLIDWKHGWNTFSIQWDINTKTFQIKSDNGTVEKFKRSWWLLYWPDVYIFCFRCFQNCEKDYGVFHLESGDKRLIPLYFNDKRPIFSLSLKKAKGMMKMTVGRVSKYLCRETIKSTVLVPHSLNTGNVDNKCILDTGLVYAVNTTRFENIADDQPSYVTVTFEDDLELKEKIYNFFNGLDVATYLVETRIGNLEYTKDDKNDISSTTQNSESAFSMQNNSNNTDNTSVVSDESETTVRSVRSNTNEEKMGTKNLKIIGIAAAVTLGFVVSVLFVRYHIKKRKKTSIRLNRLKNRSPAANSSNGVVTYNRTQEVNLPSSISERGASSNRSTLEDSIYDELDINQDITFENDLYVSFDVNPELII